MNICWPKLWQSGWFSLCGCQKQLAGWMSKVHPSFCRFSDLTHFIFQRLHEMQLLALVRLHSGQSTDFLIPLTRCSSQALKIQTTIDDVSFVQLKAQFSDIVSCTWTDWYHPLRAGAEGSAFCQSLLKTAFSPTWNQRTSLYPVDSVPVCLRWTGWCQ